MSSDRKPATAWQFRHLLFAPWRLGFFAGTLVLLLASLWWLGVQGQSLLFGRALSWQMPPAVAHGVLMVFGFMPLFFAGFALTTGPKWLRVKPVPAGAMVWPVILQLMAWVLWLAGAHGSRALMALAASCAGLGLLLQARLLWRLLAASRLQDRVHMQVMALAALVAVLCLAGVALACWQNEPALTLAWVRTGLWGFVFLTFAAASHRLVPYFTSRLMPMAGHWSDLWILYFFLSLAAFELVAIWVDFAAPDAHAWPLWNVFVLLVEALAGLAWLAVMIQWRRAQRLRARMMRMLYISFAWLPASLLLSALSQALWLWTGQAILGMAALHALGMGFLGSIMLAMVASVSSGLYGRVIVNGPWLWGLFWTLQAAVLMRIVAAVMHDLPTLVSVSALLWALAFVPWCLRLMNWMGRARPDGRPG